MAKKSNPGTRQKEGKNLVWFGEIERKLAKLLMPTFTHRCSSYYFMTVVYNSCRTALLTEETGSTISIQTVTLHTLLSVRK
jgi:hypothetical protein